MNNREKRGAKPSKQQKLTLIGEELKVPVKPKINSRSRRSNQSDEDGLAESDNLSSSSLDEGLSPAAQDQSLTDEVNLAERFGMISDNLMEKRTAARMLALNSLIETLSSHYSLHFLHGQSETLLNCLISCARRGDANESVRAFQAISLLAISVGENNRILEISQGVLNEILTNASKPIPVRAAVAKTLSFLIFLSDSHVTDILTFMQRMIDNMPLLSNSASSDLTSAMWEGWALVACALTSSQLTLILRELLPTMMKYLEHDNIDVRQSVGQAIALGWEAYSQHMEAEGINSENSEETSEEPIPVPIAPALPSDLQQKLIVALNDLRTESARHIARRDRAYQRRVFRDVVDTVEHGVPPEETITINKQKLSVEGWDGIIALHALRDVLGQGMSVHCKENDLISAIFGWELYNDNSEKLESKDDSSRKLAARAVSRARNKEQYQFNTKQRAKKRQMIMSEE